MTKFILNDYSLDYKSRLSSLHILPLMMAFEINDTIFFIRSLKSPSTAFKINDYIQFCSSFTRSFTGHKLKHHLSHSNNSKHFYFNRLPHLWNSLPPIDLDLTIETIKRQLTRFFWSHFVHHFNPSNVCTFHYLCPCSKCSSTYLLHTKLS